MNMRIKITCLMTVVQMACLSLAYSFPSPPQDDVVQENAIDQKPDQAIILVIGTGGNETYAQQFKNWASAWSAAANHTRLETIGLGENKDRSKSHLKKTLGEMATDKTLEEVWLVMIGHGTFDGERAKFNLHGPDVTAQDLKQWLKPIRCRTMVINCAASSSPFINALSSQNRIVVSATKDGYEYNFARFGEYLSRSIDDPSVDLDKDGQTSLLEAFCAASAGATQFYQQENRVVTEHALLDDNGDRRGTPATWFDGVRVNRKSEKGLPDGLIANSVFLKRRGIEDSLSTDQRAQRNRLEAELEAMRLKKKTMDQSQYLLSIEPILVKLAELYEAAAE